GRVRRRPGEAGQVLRGAAAAGRAGAHPLLAALLAAAPRPAVRGPARPRRGPRGDRPVLLTAPARVPCPPPSATRRTSPSGSSRTTPAGLAGGGAGAGG